MPEIVKNFAAASGLTTEEIGQKFFGDRPSDACGMGAVVSLTGKPSHKVFQRGLIALAGLEHRGAESADGVSGDGAGVLFKIPQSFFGDYLNSQLSSEGERAGRIGVGQIFMPKESEHPTDYLRAVQIVEDVMRQYGISNFAWRTPVVDSSVLGPIAASTEPDTRQIVFECPAGDNKKLLHTAMLEIEKRIAEENSAALNKSFYICSLSDQTMVYKAMVKPSRLADYHRDLKLFLELGVETDVMLFHQRFATNAAPNWRLAHPYRYTAHNGEINTIPSTARDAEARTADYHEPGHKAIQTTGSDTAQLDTIHGMLVVNGYSPIQAMRQLIPPALHPSQPEATQAFIKVTNATSTQGDGPAALVFTDGIQFGALADRNSLRPVDCVQVGRELLIVSSEIGAGLLKDDAGKISRIRLKGGEAIVVNLEKGEYLKPLQVEQQLASAVPYVQFLKNIDTFAPTSIISESELQRLREGPSDKLPPELLAQLKAIGFTEEDKKDVTATLAETGKEVVSSMGNTKPLAVLSNLPAVHARFSNFFPQLFAQVTNPAIDPLREGGAFDTYTRLGDRGDLIAAHPDNLKAAMPSLIELETPILTTQEFSELREKMAAKGWKAHTVDATFAPLQWRDIEKRVDELIAAAVTAVEGGATQLIVSHQALSKDNAIIPSMLVVSGIDKALKERSLRHKVNIHSEAADVHDSHTLSMNITSGADTVVPFLTEKQLLWSYAPTESDPDRAKKALKAYKKGMHLGLMKIMAKMGITTLNSYRGGHVHSALGVDRDFVTKYFGDSNTIVSSISGITPDQLAYSIARNHTNAYAEEAHSTMLHQIGRRTEVDGQIDLHTPTTLRLLGEAVDTNKGSAALFQAYSAEASRIRTEKVVTPEGHEIDRRAPILIRDLWGLKEADTPLSVEEVQSPTDIISKHFAIAAMSYGALSKPAIETLNRVGSDLNMEVNSGEGGQPEDAAYGASTMQVASGRFGVTIEYLNSPNDSGHPRHQIKITQGAKPAEGGQLGAQKNTPDIAEVRHATPGTDLVSPPPHHNIYSIEDLADLIRVLGAANPEAKTSTKLVAGTGVGEVAAGVMKCDSFEVHISGNDGGTGAAGLVSINHAGLPVEIGLANTQQNLVSKGMREPVYKEGVKDQGTISADGSVRTGRDIVIMAILGADKVSIGTAALQAMGCLMVRQCHSNTCPVGVAVQDPAYVDKFRPDAEQRLRNFLVYLAQDVQVELANLGVKSLEELRGRTDLLLDRRLLNPEAYSDQVRNLDLSPLLHVASPPANIEAIRASRAKVTQTPNFDEKIQAEFWDKIKQRAANDDGAPVVIDRTVSNTDLHIGTMMSGFIARERMQGGNPRNVLYRLRGFAGQSIGSFLAKGVKILLTGDANDSVAQGLSGGEIVIRPPANQNTDNGNAPIIIGKSALYGATSGEAFFAGSADSRFAVRNSGANAVVKGAGDYFGEYMTGGLVVSLGPVGKESFKGNSGGVLVVYDPKAGPESPVGTTMANNPKTGLPYNFMTYDEDPQKNLRQIVRLDGAHGALQHDEGYADATRALIQTFYDKTQDPTAQRILANWEKEVGNFWVTIPDQYAVARRTELKKQSSVAASALVHA